VAEYPNILARNAIQSATVTLKNSINGDLVEDSVFRLTHLTDRSRMSKFKGDGSATEQRIVWSFTDAQVAEGGIAQNLNTFVLDKNFTLTGGSAAAYLDYSTTANFASYETPVSLTDLDSDSIYWRTFTAVTRKYWRLRITGLTVAPEIFNVWLGARIILTFGPAGDFDPYEEEIAGEPVHGASGGFQWTQRFRRRVLRANFENLIDSQYDLLDSLWTQAGRDGKNWWWLTWPATEPTDPLYLNCEGRAKRFAFYRGATRGGSLEAFEVK